MRSPSFDTHATVKRLVQAGFTEPQAEAHVQVISELFEDQLATKRDLESIRLEIESIRLEIESLRRDMKEMETGLRRDMASMDTGLRRDMKQMETNLQRDIRESDSRVTIRLGLMMAGAIAVVAALVKLL